VVWEDGGSDPASYPMSMNNCGRNLIRGSDQKQARITLLIRMEIFDNQIPVFGQADDRTLNQIRVCARTADRVALMPDNHVGYGVPIGGVVAYKNAISPTGVGYDIGCGNKAVRVDMPGSELRARIAKIMDDVWTTISFGVGRKNNERVDHVLFDDQAWKLKAIASLKEMARNQLGTVGSGNPLRGSVHRRRRLCLDWCALRFARVRPQDSHALLEGCWRFRWNGCRAMRSIDR